MRFVVEFVIMGEYMQILFATGNAGKLAEVKLRLEPLGHSVRSLDEFVPGATIIEPQSSNLELVCRSKLEQALAHVRSSGISEAKIDAVMVEDAGLFIDALAGFPGVYSAYVFETVGLAGILRLLEPYSEKQRKATFRCITGIATDSDVSMHVGECSGGIVLAVSGGGGFGYDPIFKPDGFEITFAEMAAEEKSAISHRGRALDSFVAELSDDNLQ
jgi:XTP/dITP diphosphohydrolase